MTIRSTSSEFIASERRRRFAGRRRSVLRTLFKRSRGRRLGDVGRGNGTGDRIAATSDKRGYPACAMILVLLMVPLLLVGCVTMKTTLRYRLTVVVDTPQGIRTGSSVVEVRGYLSPAFPGPEAGGGRLHSRGEATPVDLGNGKYLFAVFSWVSPPERTFTMLTVPFRDQLPPRSPDPSAIDESMMKEFRALADARGIRKVEPDDYPVIATFTDRRNPYSVRIAPATELSTIMPGYRVVRMTVEITDAPVSNIIREILPWIRCKDIGFLNTDVKKYWLRPFPEFQKIGTGAFIQGATNASKICNSK